jgi:hypothetical protein
VLLPVSVLNIGPRDAALVLLLAGAGATAEQALALSALILVTLLVNWGLSCLVFVSTARA